MAGPLLQRWWRTEIHAQSQVFTWGGTDARRRPPRTPGAGARWGRGAPGAGRGSFPGGQAEAASLLSFSLREALDDKRNRELPTICQNVLSSHTLQNLKTQFRQKEEKLDSPSNINTHINLCVCKRVCTRACARVCARAHPPTHTHTPFPVFLHCQAYPLRVSPSRRQHLKREASEQSGTVQAASRFLLISSYCLKGMCLMRGYL